jgi:hypothetical protein
VSARRVRLAALMLGAALSTWAASATHAQTPAPAPPDTALGHFLGQLSDSTDQYFGATAAPLDTAGLDTVLADRMSDEPVRGFKFSVLPAFAFNRVDGPTPGVTFGIEGPRAPRARLGLGRLGLKLAYATGPNDLLGGAEYLNRLRLGGGAYDLRLFAGRVTSRMNRDNSDRFLNTWRAFLTGNDYTQYLRHDGFEVAVGREETRWRVRASWRDMLESPLPVTATWNLFHREPVTRTNLQAAFGRTSEFGLETGLRLPLGFPLQVEVGGQLSDPSLGSAFDYRRVRAALGAEVPVARAFSFVPQFAYGRQEGDAIPQAAFYLGGGPTLKSLNRDARGGTRLAVARLDVFEAPDLLTLLHIKHPAALPLQAAVFAGAGAVWGADPYGGPAVAGEAWPHEQDWLAEAGVSITYSSALFDQGGMLRFNYAWPLGPTDRAPRFSLAFTRVLDLLHRIGD